MTSGLPVDVLEKRAADQRRQLRKTVVQLRQTVKEKLDVKRPLRDYIWPSAGVLAVIGLVLGYSVAGIFTGE
jgi:ElaB/YqjD/DUF883 family membrane-anchored ribosome-binding protein